MTKKKKTRTTQEFLGWGSNLVKGNEIAPPRLFFSYTDLDGTTIGKIKPQLFMLMEETVTPLSASSFWIIRPRWKKGTAGWETVIPKSSSDRWIQYDIGRTLIDFITTLLLLNQDVLNMGEEHTKKLTRRKYSAELCALIKGHEKRLMSRPTKTLTAMRQTMTGLLAHAYVRGWKLQRKIEEGKKVTGNLCTLMGLVGECIVMTCEYGALVDYAMRHKKETGNAPPQVKKLVNMVEEGSFFDSLNAIALGTKSIHERTRILVEHSNNMLMTILAKHSKDVNKVIQAEMSKKAGTIMKSKLKVDLQKKSKPKEINLDSVKMVGQLPTFNSAARKKALTDNPLYSKIYNTLSNTLDEEKDYVYGYRIGGSDQGQNSKIGNAGGKGLTMFATPFLAIANAAMTNAQSTIMWIGRFKRKALVQETGVIEGKPTGPFLYLDVETMLQQAVYGTQYMLKHAPKDNTKHTVFHSRINALAAMTTAPRSTMSGFDPSQALIEQAIQANPYGQDHITHLYLSMLLRSRMGSLLQRVFNPLQALIHQAPRFKGKTARRLCFGSALQDAMIEAGSDKQRRWELFNHINNLYTSKLYGVAVMVAHAKKVNDMKRPNPLNGIPGG